MALRKRRKPLNSNDLYNHYNQYSAEELLFHLENFCDKGNDVYFGVTPCYNYGSDKKFVCCQIAIVSDLDEDNLPDYQDHGCFHGKTIKDAVIKACVELEIKIS